MYATPFTQIHTHTRPHTHTHKHTHRVWGGFSAVHSVTRELTTNKKKLNITQPHKKNNNNNQKIFSRNYLREEVAAAGPCTDHAYGSVMKTRKIKCPCMIKKKSKTK